MKRTLFYLVFALVAYLVALVVTIPAGFAYDQYRQYQGESALPFELHGLSGTLWTGRATQAVAWGKPLGRLEWSVSPFALLFARADVDWRIMSSDGYLQGNLVLNAANRVWLNDIEGQLPVRRLTALSPFMPVVAEGSVSLRLDDAELAMGTVEQAQGKIVWHQAALAAPAAMKFGDLSVTVEVGDDGALVGHVSDHGGPLQAGGKITLLRDGRYNVDLQLAAQAGAEAGLKSGLAMLGRADAQGRYQLKYQGKI